VGQICFVVVVEQVAFQRLIALLDDFQQLIQ
jgi:hypothetical protein